MWLGHCAVCGGEFIVTSPAWLLGVSPEDADRASGAFNRKHCDLHSLSREESLAFTVPGWARELVVDAGLVNWLTVPASQQLMSMFGY